METASAKIAEAVSTAQCPAVLFSGGRDSLLLLALAREVRQDVCAIWFQTGGPTSFVRRIIHEWGLTALSWGPADVFLLAEGPNRVLVHEYAFGDSRLPVINDIELDEQCAHQMPSRTPELYPGFDVLLWGVKDCDTHWLKGDAPFPADGFEFGGGKLYAPLRHLSDKQVAEAIVALNLPYECQPDSLPMCTACISRVESAAISEFRQRTGLEVSHG